MSAVGPILLTILLLILAAIISMILNHFGDRKTFGYHVQLTCFVAYFIPFTIILILPLDLASTKYRYCERYFNDCEQPLINVDEIFLYSFWRTVYWLTFNVQMFLVPIMQGYERSGAFTVGARIKDGIMENVVFYAICGVPSILFVLYAIVGLGVPISMLLDLAIPAMNAYGLILLVALMSFGLVEIPRGLWIGSNVETKLKMLETEVTSLKEACIDTEAELYEVARMLGLAATKISNDDPLRPKLTKLMEMCPLAMTERNVERDGPPIVFNEAYLATLNARLKRGQNVNRREQAKLQMLQTEAFFYQDVIANARNPDRIFESVFWSIKVPDNSYKTATLTAAWWWFVRVEPILKKVLSIICLIFSLLIIWSESTFQFSSIRLSIPAMLLDPANSSYFTTELLSIAFICYMCTCTYSTILRLRILDLYQMVPNQNTDPVSLLFVGAYLCKLTFPLCYNFLNMGGVANAPNNDYTNFPVFIQYFGPAVNLTPLFGDGYNDWVAFLVLVVCILIGFNLHGRILKLFGIQNYFFESIKQPKGDAEGRQILEQARIMEIRRMQRGDTGIGAARIDAAPNRIRNTADLLAKYKDRDIEKGSKRDQGSSGSPKGKRTFGTFSFGSGKDSKGYESL